MANDRGGRPPQTPPSVPPAVPTVQPDALDTLLAEAEAAAVAIAATQRVAQERDAEDGRTAASLDPNGHDLHPVLTNSDVIKIRAEAREKLLEKQKASARKNLLSQEMNRLEREEGLTGATGIPELDEMVTITLELAEHSPNIVINGRPYWHGHTYTVPRHIAQSLGEIMFRGHEHQRVLDGKSVKEGLARRRDTVLSPTKVERAPSHI